MKSLSKFLMEHMFITMSGLAALVHSVWTIDVFFSGAETDVSINPWGAIFRKIVAFFIAAAIDVGQIYTSVEIKHGQRSKAKYATFGFFALCTYVLQYIYLVYHVPAMELSSGIRAEWVPVVKFISDACIWIIPLLLPASTLLYTLSQTSTATHISKERVDEVIIELQNRAEMQRQEMEQEYLAKIEGIHKQLAATTGGAPLLQAGGTYSISCPDCSWEKTGYSDVVSAQNGLRSHKPYCKKTKVSVPGQ